MKSRLEILSEYGKPIRCGNQYHKQDEIVLGKNTLIWKQCEECKQARQVQYQNYLQHPDASCLSCSKLGMRNAQYGKLAPNRGIKSSKAAIQKTVAARRANNSYRHSDETRKQMSLARRGKKNGNYGHRWTREKREALGQHIARLHVDGRYRRKKDTKPEREVKALLDRHGIACTPQHQLSNKVFDFFIPSHQLLIEVDGTYWHGKGLSAEEMNKTQLHNHKNDKVKNQLASDANLMLLRIWEDEIDTGFAKVLSYMEKR